MEHNVLIGDFVTERDRDLFFGPMVGASLAEGVLRLEFGAVEPGTEFRRFPVSTRWPALLRELGIFRSAAEAERNGWDKPIPEGFSDVTIGKRHTRVTVLKITC